MNIFVPRCQQSPIKEKLYFKRSIGKKKYSYSEGAKDMRGYQKKVIYLKNTGSPVFEEAYFVIKSDKSQKKEREKNKSELLEEANRIIEENACICQGRKTFKIDLRSALVFGSGFLLSALISLAAILLVM